MAACWTNTYAALQELVEETDDAGSSEEGDHLESSLENDEGARSCVPSYDCEFLRPGLHVNKEGRTSATEHWRLFHESCTKCSKMPRFRNKNLCARCKHLRLRHILQCVREETWVNGLFLYFGTVKDIALSTEGCTFCHFLKDIILKAHREAKSQSEEAQRIYGDDPCILRLESFSINSYLPERGCIPTPIWRPGGLLLDVDFRLPMGAKNAPRSVFVHFRCLDASPLESEERLFKGKVEVPTEYRRHKSRKAQPKTVQPVVSQAPADIVKEYCTWKVIKGWIADCVSLHSHSTAVENSVGDGRPSLLVDIQDRCLIHTKPTFLYAALSYVWGPSVGLLQCTRAKLKALMNKNALRGGGYTPLTIRDSMEVCRKLNLRYIWIDRLCIVQDDDELREHEIGRMAEIYSNAVVTIAAVDGQTSHSGLCGVSQRKREAQISAIFDGLEAFDILPTYQQSVPNSAWSSRGWTYQEMCLSRRMLLFTEHQVFFRCASHICYEDPSVGSYGIHEWPIWSVPTDIAYGFRSLGRFDAFHYFREGVQKYAMRCLSQQSDVYNAFLGVTKRLYPSNKDKITFGMPDADFDRALLWEPVVRYRPRETGSDCVVPSWSWASHDGPLLFGHGVDVAGSDLEYFVFDKCSNRLRKIEKSICQVSSNWSQQPFTFGDLFEDLFENQVVPRQSYMSLSRYSQKLDVEFSGKQQTNYTHDIVSPFDPGFIDQASRIPGALVFNAPVASFTLHDHTALNNDDQLFRRTTKDSEDVVLTIINQHGRMAGFIRVDKRWAEYYVQSTNGHPESLPERLHKRISSKPHRVFNFVALSITRSPTFDEMECYVEYQVSRNIISNRDLPGGCPTGVPPHSLDNDSDDEINDDKDADMSVGGEEVKLNHASGISRMEAWWNDPAPVRKIEGVGYVGDVAEDVRFYTTEGKRILKTPMVNVMLIEEQGGEAPDWQGGCIEKPLIYRRLGVGLIYLARWIDAEPQNRTIILQ